MKATAPAVWPVTHLPRKSEKKAPRPGCFSLRKESRGQLLEVLWPVFFPLFLTDEEWPEGSVHDLFLFSRISSDIRIKYEVQVSREVRR